MPRIGRHSQSPDAFRHASRAGIRSYAVRRRLRARLAGAVRDYLSCRRQQRPEVLPNKNLWTIGAGDLLIHYALFALSLLAAQASHTLSTRAKASGSLRYVGWTSALSHATWISNGVMVWRIGQKAAGGADWWFDAAWYVFWATAGNVGAVWAAKKYIER